MSKKLVIGLFTFLFMSLFYSIHVFAEEDIETVNVPTTGFEDSNGEEWTTHEEELAFLEKVSEQSDRVSYTEIGQSVEGRPLHLVRIGFPAPPMDDAIAQGRNMLIMGTPHGNEPAGREMALQLLRNLAFTKDETLINQLKNVTVLVIPSQNPDGSAANKRFTSEGVDLNQDRINLRTLEGQAIGRVINEFSPDIVVSSHEKLRSPPDISMLWPTNLNVDNELRDLNIKLVEDYIRPDVENAGFSTGLYNGIGSEWNLRNMGGLQHSLTVLYESGRDGEPLKRVEAQLESSASVLRFYREQLEEVTKVVEEAPERKATIGAEQSQPFYLDGDENPNAIILETPPCGYLINAQQAEQMQKHVELFSIETEKWSEDRIFVSMAQPMMNLVPLLLDARANNHEVAGLPV